MGQANRMLAREAGRRPPPRRAGRAEPRRRAQHERRPARRRRRQCQRALVRASLLLLPRDDARLPGRAA